MITAAVATLTTRMLSTAPTFSTAEPLSGTPLSSPEPTASSAPNLYTLDECFYQVNTSDVQKAVYGIMATSLIINFGISVWWSRLYFYKRKHRGSEEEEYPAEKDMDEISMNDLDISRNQSARPRRVVIDASRNAVAPVEEGYGGKAASRKLDKAETEPYGNRPGASHEGPRDRMGPRAHERDDAGEDPLHPPGGARARMNGRGLDRDAADQPKPNPRAGTRAQPDTGVRGRDDVDEQPPNSRGGAKAQADVGTNDGEAEVYEPYRPGGRAARTVREV